MVGEDRPHLWRQGLNMRRYTMQAGPAEVLEVDLGPDRCASFHSEVPFMMGSTLYAARVNHVVHSRQRCRVLRNLSAERPGDITIHQRSAI